MASGFLRRHIGSKAKVINTIVVKRVRVDALNTSSVDLTKGGFRKIGILSVDLLLYVCIKL